MQGIDDFGDGFKATEKTWLESVKVARALKMTGPYGLCWPLDPKGPAWMGLGYSDDEVRSFIDKHAWGARKYLVERWADAGFLKTMDAVQALIVALLSLEDQPAHDFMTVLKPDATADVVRQRRMMVATVYLETTLNLKSVGEVFERTETDAVKDVVLWLYTSSQANWPTSTAAVTRALEDGPMEDGWKATGRRGTAEVVREEMKVVDGGIGERCDRRAVAG